MNRRDGIDARVGRAREFSLGQGVDVLLPREPAGWHGLDGMEIAKLR